MFRINGALRHADRKLIFNVDGLHQLATQPVDRSPAYIVEMAILVEGGFNRTFLITVRDSFQMVARIPYPVTVPKYYAVASELAAMDLLRSSRRPTPKVSGYLPGPNNPAGTGYIFIEYARATYGLT